MSSLKQSRLTAEEYLHIERGATTKSEFWNGEMFAMSGESRHHGRIKWNFVEGLGPQLKTGSCEGFVADMRVRTTSGLYAYPDLVVVCGEPRFEDRELDTLLNPTLLVEILSDSTESYDRGRKFSQYRGIPSLKEYVLVSQREPRIESYRRAKNDSWLLSDTHAMDASIHFASIGCDLKLADIYRRVQFKTDA